MKKFLLTILFIGMIFPVFSENWATEKSKEFGAEKHIKEVKRETKRLENIKNKKIKGNKKTKHL